MYKVDYMVDGNSEDTLKVGTESEALGIAAEWARDARSEAEYLHNEVSVIVQKVTLIAEFPVKRLKKG